MGGLPKGADGAGSADHPGETHLAHLFHDIPCGKADMGFQHPARLGPHRALIFKHIEQTQHPQLHAPAEADLRLVADHRLGAAAADIDHQHILIFDRNRAAHCQEDQAGFLVAGDHPGGDAGLAHHLIEEFAAIACLAGGAGGSSDDLIHPMAIGQLHVAANRFQAVAKRLFTQLIGGKDPHPQLNHLLLTIDHLEAIFAGRFHNHHVDGVGTDVDGSEFHGIPLNAC